MWSGAWPSLPITNLKSSLNDVRGLVATPAHGQNDDVTRALSSLLVVRASGYLEQVVIECFRAYTNSKSISRVAAFAVSWISYGQNPTPGKLEDLIRKMDGDWAHELSGLFDDDDQRLRREISLLVDKRNKIAHGQQEGISARKALSLADDAVDVADWFVDRFDPR